MSPTSLAGGRLHYRRLATAILKLVVELAVEATFWPRQTFSQGNFSKAVFFSAPVLGSVAAQALIVLDWLAPGDMRASRKIDLHIPARHLPVLELLHAHVRSPAAIWSFALTFSHAACAPPWPRLGLRCDIFCTCAAPSQLSARRAATSSFSGSDARHKCQVGISARSWPAPILPTGHPGIVGAKERFTFLEPRSAFFSRNVSLLLLHTSSDTEQPFAYRLRIASRTIPPQPFTTSTPSLWHAHRRHAR
ncbi:hypothetical protein P153DRAFT_384334 [Dothidotthia symphoricarpi CBS 119687]|uniref:Uncharacterized protein n=1 Tax=Dothidotthia symphoricarpi CBS 119687 TaxID=1392245 RepID=A0A6A6AH41_9PLEO|nr:uncharacterized protein P153DRAFT_384334 [Dothidotthia symphoricarpi CBS 119687]KAF2131120.1 hypothetical protein P153DRAFT_384334 [Dothidotthia symphoricarpi CBS 119687]